MPEDPEVRIHLDEGINVADFRPVRADLRLPLPNPLDDGVSRLFGSDGLLFNYVQAHCGGVQHLLYGAGVLVALYD